MAENLPLVMKKIGYQRIYGMVKKKEEKEKGEEENVENRKEGGKGRKMENIHVFLKLKRHYRKENILKTVKQQIF